MDEMQLHIDGNYWPDDEWHRIAIRFVQTKAGPRPVLYLDGKRVTREWQLLMDHYEAASKDSNANTN